MHERVSAYLRRAEAHRAECPPLALPGQILLLRVPDLMR